jgi:hypothetical protein
MEEQIYQIVLSLVVARLVAHKVGTITCLTKRHGEVSFEAIE